MSESVQHDDHGSSLHDRWCLRYDEQCSSLHAEGLNTWWLRSCVSCCLLFSEGTPLVTSWAIDVSRKFCANFTFLLLHGCWFRQRNKTFSHKMGLYKTLNLSPVHVSSKERVYPPHMSRERGILVLWSLQIEVCVLRSEFQRDVWLDKKINDSHRPPTLQVSESNSFRIVWDKKGTHAGYRCWKFMER